MQNSTGYFKIQPKQRTQFLTVNQVPSSINYLQYSFFIEFSIMEDDICPSSLQFPMASAGNRAQREFRFDYLVTPLKQKQAKRIPQTSQVLICRQRPKLIRLILSQKRRRHQAQKTGTGSDGRKAEVIANHAGFLQNAVILIDCLLQVL